MDAANANSFMDHRASILGFGGLLITTSTISGLDAKV